MTLPLFPHHAECDMDEDCASAKICGAPDSAILRGDSLDLLTAFDGEPDLIATDPPYAFGGAGDEHEISATVAIVLREAAARLKRGRWMVVMCAASWRSTAYMVESVRGIVQPVRIGTWCKPVAKSKTRTAGWAWASVNVVAFRKGKAEDHHGSEYLDHITASPVIVGRRAELPAVVADWMVQPFAVRGGLMLDPFAGSGAVVDAARRAGMVGVGFERADK